MAQDLPPAEFFPYQVFPDTAYHKLELVCHWHRGGLLFSTPDEYKSHARTGRPRWHGWIARSAEGLGVALWPGMDERLMSGPHYQDAERKVSTEGVCVTSAGTEVRPTIQ